MNTDRLRWPAYIIVLLLPGLLFGWWSPSAQHTFWILLSFMMMWAFFWAMWFFGEGFTAVETVNYLVREAQLICLGIEFVLTVGMLLFDVSLRTCLFVNGFTYSAFALSSLVVIFFYADLIHDLKGEEEHD